MKKKLLRMFLSSIITIALLQQGRLCSAENIDPDSDGSQYAWSENRGWLNLEPDGGQGVEVGDSGLTGWIWGETIGWISLSCENRDTCATNNYGVTNDGSGNLSGYGWCETVGWISFSCENPPDTCTKNDYRVTINGTTGEFGGQAWGENIGWINFDLADGRGAKTSWRACTAGCLIGETCYGHGETNPTNVCEVCDAGQSTTAWSDNDGASCDDVLFCNGTDECLSGTCSEHAGNPCPDDGLFCTGVESCNESTDQCVTTGNPCFCTGVGSCDEGSDQCVPTGDPCPSDGNECTDDLCVENGDLCEYPCNAVDYEDSCCEDPACSGEAICTPAQHGVVEEWVARHDGTGHDDDRAYDIAVDASDNVFVAGYATNAGSKQDYITIKYDSDGNEEWATPYNGGGNDIDKSYAIGLDASGNAHVTGGSYAGPGASNFSYVTVKYDTNGNEQWVDRYASGLEAYAIAVDASGNAHVTGISLWGPDYDFVTIKYDSNGNRQWVEAYHGGIQDDYGRAIGLDASGNVYVTGESIGISFDFATVKYDAAGNEQWASRYNGDRNAQDYPKAIAVDAAGNAYVTGYSNTNPSSNYPDCFTIKYDTNGNEQWRGIYNGAGNNNDSGRDIALDAAGNVYVTGFAHNGASGDRVTIKYDTAGNEQWAQLYHDPHYGGTSGEAIALDAASNVYVTGTANTAGVGDYLTIMYDTNGNEQWVQIYDGTGNGTDYAQAIALDTAGNVYVTGYSENAAGDSDAVTVKYGPCWDNDGDKYEDEACGGDDCDDDPGACGADCSPGDTETCDGYDNDCDGSIDEEPEAGLSCDIYPHAGGLCAAGSCAMGDCDPGYYDCDGDWTNGCETDIGGAPLRVVINEVLYDPAGDEPSGEWVEIYVASGCSSDLGGYKVIDQDGYSITFPSFTPRAGEFIVVHTGGDPLSNDLTGPTYHIYRGYGAPMWSNTGDDVVIENGSGECLDYMAYGNGGSINPPPAGCAWGAGTNPVSSTEGTSISLKVDGQDSDSPSDWTESGQEGTLGPHTEGMVCNPIQGSSGSDGCDECDGGTGLPSGFPDYLVPPTDRYRDYITIHNSTGSPLALPVRADLVSLTAGAMAVAPPAIGTGLQGGTYWEFSDDDLHSPGVSGTTFSAGAKISEMWEFAPNGNPFSFWVDLSAGSAREERPGMFISMAGPGDDRGPAPEGVGEVHVVDDGTVELHTGSEDGTCVLANRFALSTTVSLESVSFYTSGSAAGDLAEVILYEDRTGEAPTPASVMEAWRTTVVLGAGSFQTVPAGGCPTLNPDGFPGAAIFVAVADRAEGSYSIGIDLDGPYAGSSYVSTDGGLTYRPTSSLPIIDGNAMIRVTLGEASACFINAVMD